MLLCNINSCFNNLFVKYIIADMKKLELVDKYNKLKESGKVEDYMGKRRKKTATKDHRYVPYERR